MDAALRKDSPTKQRIRDTAREMFNRLGYTNVTIAQLAQGIGMAEGNLWYHYKTKQDLVLAIQHDFGARCRTDFRATRRDDPIEAYAEFLKAWRGLLDDFKFLFVDSGSYGPFVADIDYDIRGGMGSTVRHGHKLLMALEQAGHIVGTGVNLRDRAEQALVVLTFHFRWVAMSKTPDEAAGVTAAHAVEQHLTLLEGVVAEDALAAIRQGV